MRIKLEAQGCVMAITATMAAVAEDGKNRLKDAALAVITMILGSIFATKVITKLKEAAWACTTMVVAHDASGRNWTRRQKGEKMKAIAKGIQAIELVRVPFDGGHIDAVQDERGIWAGIRRMCEDIGVDYAGQFTKLKASHWATVEMISTVDASGRNYDMSMLRADCIAKWLSEINPNKVAPRIKSKLEAYQVKARDVLAAHFTPVAAEAAGIDTVKILKAALASAEASIFEANERIQAQEIELSDMRSQLVASTSQLVASTSSILAMTKVIENLQAAVVYRPTGAVTKEEASIIESQIVAIANIRNRTWGLKQRSAWMRVTREVRKRADWPMDSGNSWANLPHSRYGEVNRILKQMVAEDAAISNAIRAAFDKRQLSLKLN